MKNDSFMHHEWIIKDKWLGGLLRKTVCKVVVPAMADDMPRFEGALNDLVSGQSLFAYAKVDVNALDCVHLLETRGFRLIDTSVQFDKSLQPEKKFAGNCMVRLAGPFDEAALALLGRNCFSFSRFHLDTNITRETADMIKGEWVSNYFSGRRGDAMVVAEVDGRQVGFLQLIFQRPDALVIDLIAVDAQQRRKGVAGDMILFAEKSFAEFPKIIVGTQVSNTPSIRTYEEAGFRLRSAEYVFHYHK